MLPYTASKTATFTDTINQPQDALDDVIVSTVNPQDATLLDNCSALYRATVGGALREMNMYLDWEANTDEKQGYGYGKTVGIVGIYNDATISSFQPVVGFSPVRRTLYTPAIAPVGTASFAQDAIGETVIGHSPELNQKIWRSTDGGATWAAITLPGSVPAANGVTCAYDASSGNFYVLRRLTGAVYAVYRSTDDGATWTNTSTTLAHLGGPPPADSIAFRAGEIYVNTDLNSLNTTWLSTDNGVTWSSAYAPSSRYVNSVVELDGEIIALGHDSSTGYAYYAKRTGGAWVQEALTGALPSGSTFTRFSTRVGPFVVALAIDAFASESTTIGWWVYWSTGAPGRVMVHASADLRYNAYQANSPGGIHVSPLSGGPNVFTLATVELW